MAVSHEPRVGKMSTGKLIEDSTVNLFVIQKQ